MNETSESSTVLRELVLSEKGNGEFVKVDVVEFKGYRYIDLRRWTKDSETGNLHPTRKGITLGPSQFECIASVFAAKKDEVLELLNNSQINRSENSKEGR